MDLDMIKFDKDGLVPCIVQEVNTGEVMMMAYVIADSIKMTLETGFTHFWSRSRQVYWKKGETSGSTQEVKDLRYDCDGDTLLAKVVQNGSGACHTGERTCFYRSLA